MYGPYREDFDFRDRRPVHGYDRELEAMDRERERRQELAAFDEWRGTPGLAGVSGMEATEVAVSPATGECAEPVWRRELPPAGSSVTWAPLNEEALVVFNLERALVQVEESIAKLKTTRDWLRESLELRG